MLYQSHNWLYALVSFPLRISVICVIYFQCAYHFRSAFQYAYHFRSVFLSFPPCILNVHVISAMHFKCACHFRQVHLLPDCERLWEADWPGHGVAPWLTEAGLVNDDMIMA